MSRPPITPARLTNEGRMTSRAAAHGIRALPAARITNISARPIEFDPPGRRVRRAIFARFALFVIPAIHTARANVRDPVFVLL